MKRLYDFVEKVVGMDKVAHFFGVAFVALVVALVYEKVAPCHSALTYAAWAFVFGVCLGFGKETVDAMNGRRYDLGDVAASAVGAFVAFVAALALV